MPMKIASPALKTALDQEASRGNADRLTLETDVRDLALKSERLENRAAAIDDIVAKMAAPSLGAAASSGPTHDGVFRATTPPGAGGLRLEDHAAFGADPVDAETTSGAKARASKVARDIDRLADHQARVMAALAGPTIRSVERMAAALTKTGLSFDRRHTQDGLPHNVPKDVGGPFVPLSAGGFEQNAALLQDATAQQAHLTALIAAVPLRKPLVGSLDVTSGFGARLDPFLGRPAMHTGIDLRDSLGEAVRATATGTVSIAGADGGYGNLVEIDHGNGLRTRYAHLGSIDVIMGQKVVPGAIVGLVGATGRATGPHLHYEVRIDGEPVDPTRFLKAGADLFPG